ncbi:MAG TPA: DUF488 family protein [bacterium]|nr:DUF488 family protein [bacterium]
MNLRLRTVQCGAPRKRGEGLRIGVVRLLPRGVYKKDYAKLDFFDVWLPILAPSRELMKWAKGQAEFTPQVWKKFEASYRREMDKTDARQVIQLLAELAKTTPIAIGCYCPDEAHCHRSILKELIVEAAKGAK